MVIQETVVAVGSFPCSATLRRINIGPVILKTQPINPWDTVRRVRCVGKSRRLDLIPGPDSTNICAPESPIYFLLLGDVKLVSPVPRAYARGFGALPLWSINND